MQGETGTGPAAKPDDSMPSTYFRTYCESEFERRRNSGQEFAGELCRTAMELALAKLRRLEEQRKQ